MRFHSARLSAAVGRWGIVLASVMLLVTPAAALAQAPGPPPPKPGSPFDRFVDRLPVGEQNLAVLYEGIKNEDGDLVPAPGDLRVFDLDPKVDADSGEFESWTGATKVSRSDVTSSSRQSMVTARLGTRKDLEGELVDDGREGLLLAGTGRYKNTPNCQASEICVVYLEPTSAGVSEKPNHLGLDVQPVDGTAVSVAAGRFDAEGAPSILVAWIGSRNGRRHVWVQHVGANRDKDGDVTGLKTLGGPVDVTDAATSVQSDNVTLVVGEFARKAGEGNELAGNGRDYAAILSHARDNNSAKRWIAAGFVRGTASGTDIAVELKSTTANAPTGAKSAPVAAAAREEPRPLVVGGPHGLDRLVLHTTYLDHPFAIDWNGRSGRASELKITGDTTPAPDSRDKSIVRVGDIDTDGAEEVATLVGTTVHIWGDERSKPGFQVTSRRTSANASTALSANVSPTLSWERDDTLKDVALVAADARPIEQQAVAPDPAAPHRHAVQLYVVGRFTNQPVRIVGLRFARSAGAWSLQSFGRFDVAAPDSPAARGMVVAPVALSGYAELGKPKHTEMKRTEPLVVLNAPPTHFDVLDGRPYDLNFCWAGNQYLIPPVCYFQSTYHSTQTAEVGVTSETREDWSVSTEVSAGAGATGIAEVELELTASYGKNFSSVGSKVETTEIDQQVSAQNSDQVYVAERSYDLLEYPLFQPGAEKPSAYVMAATPHTLSRNWIDLHTLSGPAHAFRSTHQVGNVLSYPPDQRPEGKPFVDGSTFAHETFRLGTSASFRYSLSWSRLNQQEIKTERTLNLGATFRAEAETFATFGTEVSGNYSRSQLNTTTTKVGKQTQLTAALGGLDGSLGEVGYTVMPFAYFSQDGALVLDYATEPGESSVGPTWWQRHYGAAPDLTLNLPRLRDYEAQAGISSDALRFVSPSVEVLRPVGGSCGAAVYDPDYARPDRELCLRATVHNYSLDEDGSPPTQVRFYDGDPDLGGVRIGQADVVALASRGSTTATATRKWTPSARHAQSGVRVFAEVDPGGQVGEIHEDNNKGFATVTVGTDSKAPTLRAPRKVVAKVSPGSDDITVDWRMPSAQPPQRDGFRWRVVAYPETGDPQDKVVDGSKLSTTLADLPAGRYRVAVFAIAADGNERSPVSNPAEPVDIATSARRAPSAPRDPVASPRDGGAVVSWIEPDDDGGAPITGYQVTARPGGATTRVAPNNREAQISELQNGTQYTFTVVAQNANGRGAESVASNAVTPQGKPAAPRIVNVVSTEPGRVRVDWRAPATGMGIVGIARYEVCAVEGACLLVDGRSTTTSVGDLDPARAVSFVVTAISLLGTRSEPSEPSARVIPVVGSGDRVAPAPLSVGDFRFSPRTLRVPQRGGSGTRRGRFSFALSQGARVTILVERKLAGRRSRGRCVAPRRGLKRKCTRYRRQTALAFDGQAGDNTVPFSGRVRTRTLAPGSYRATITATTSTGTIASPRRTTFRVARTNPRR